MKLLLNLEKYKLQNPQYIVGGIDTTDPDDPIDKDKVKVPGNNGE